MKNELPAHYIDCDRFQTYDYGTRNGKCDCAATADILAMLRVAALIRAEIRPCPEHPMPLPKPSCWTCGRNGAFARAARIAANGDAQGVDDGPSSPAVVAQSAPSREGDDG